jgi:hypothetical protein
MECIHKQTKTKTMTIARTTSNSSYEYIIPILNSSPSHKISEFDLKQSCFNPNKASPPNPWTERLLNRLSKYQDKNDSNL